MMNYRDLKLDELKRLLLIKEGKLEKADNKFLRWKIQNEIEEIKNAIKEKEEI